MTFEVGRQKTGGRKRGTPNRRTRSLDEALDSSTLVEHLISSIQELSSKERVDALVQILPYLYPKRKPTDKELPEETLKNRYSAFFNAAREECINSDRLKNGSDLENELTSYAMEIKALVDWSFSRTKSQKGENYE